MSTEPLSSERRASREALLRAARELIVTRSFGNVGIAEICEHAGVRKGSLYHFFPGKEALALAMLDALHAEFEREVVLPSLAGPGPLTRRVDAFVSAVHAFQARMQAESGHLPGCPFGNLAVETAPQHPELHAATRAHLNTLTAHFRHALEEAVTAGELPAATDTTATAERWLALMEGILVLARASQDPDTILRLGPVLGQLVHGNPPTITDPETRNE